MSFRRGNLGFFLLEGGFWATYCTIYGFMVTILREYGFSSEICGLVTTLQCVVIMLIQPVYGYLVDQVTTPKRGFLTVMVLGLVFAAPLPWVFRLSAPLVIAYLTFLALFIYSGGALADAWTVAVINRTHGMDYAACRGGGSILYAFTALFTGNLIAPFGVESLFVLHLILGIATVTVGVFLVDSEKIDQTSSFKLTKKKAPGIFQSIKILLKNPNYVLFTACMCLFNFGTRPYNTYMPMVLEQVGGNSSHFGIALFISALGEMVFMLIASRLLLRGLPPAYLYAMAVSVLVFRFLLMAVVDNLWVMLATQVIQAVGFGFNLRMNAEYLVRTAPEGYQGMAIMLSASISNGLGCVLGNFLGGYMIEWWGIQTYVLICTAIMALVLPLFFPTVLREYRSRQESRRQYLLYQQADDQRTDNQ